ncbi:hypothetical protein [Brachybacterium hainanense]|uniref:DUF3153 domain-containing protein n=1 Tax=Brachybacterium hainanense TaxID=1541174 RepID=A0ABV6RA22_9MICO
MQKILAAVLVLLGLAGLVVGRLGETTWAPSTEHTAVVDLADAGPAVVIDPGVLYVGGDEGTVTITGASDVSLITAANDDIAAYLESTRYTRITGVPDWTTLSTEVVNPDGAAEIADPTSSDLWRSVDTSPSPATLDVAEFRAGETSAGNEQPFRAILVVTDGTAAGAQRISITWPVDAKNAWVPYAYAGGATVAVIGLIWFVLAFRGRRREEPAEQELASAEDEITAREPAPATASAPLPVPGRGAPAEEETRPEEDGEADLPQDDPAPPAEETPMTRTHRDGEQA